jgi:NAD(P)-dependent dehydrogenase (short-subunit alcohol dehydrogenase family)
MDLKLASKIALVTGSSRGIGLATGRAFCRRGLPADAVGALS